MGSSMPWRLRNDQYCTSRMITSAAPKKIGIFVNWTSAASPMMVMPPRWMSTSASRSRSTISCRSWLSAMKFDSCSFCLKSATTAAALPSGETSALM